MTESPNVKLVIYAPLSHGEAVRLALGEAGAGKIGNYSFCSFSSLGNGRFLPNNAASPAVGEPGKHEVVEEERIEVVCPAAILQSVIDAVRKVHPYEEIAFDVYPLLSLE